MTNPSGVQLLGTLAAGMAHDLRNVLNGMFLRVQLLERTTSVDIAPVVAQLRNDIFVGVQLLDRVRNLTPTNDVPSMVDLNDVIAEASELAKFGHALSTRQATVMCEPGTVRPLTARRGEIVAAVLNLLLNAADAMPGGRVTVRTGSTEKATWIEVKDDGPGIPDAVKAHMFDPFFTTKGSRGTGLGLASVAACMRFHGGTTRVRTIPGRGTSITLRFPTAGHDRTKPTEGS